MRDTINLLQEFSIPLIAGVFVALGLANYNPELYETLIGTPLYDLWGAITAGGGHGGHAEGWGYYLTLHFLANDIFMVFFFGVAAKEITEACLPGGSLNPVSKAINPLVGCLGGVFGPIGAFFLLNAVMGQPDWSNGWGIPTATDIALAWVVARLVFGAGHPAISFLLLLAVVDDGIGLAIIAFFYPDPTEPTEWLNAWWILAGMAAAFGLRRMGVRSWVPYIALGGALSWWGLYSAHLHPALALVFIVPFLPAGRRDLGLFVEEREYEELDERVAPQRQAVVHNTLDEFEHHLKLFVDFGLFFFAFANAGVLFSGITNLTWIILLSLLVGKAIGIVGFSYVGTLLGFPLPDGMRLKHVLVAGVVAGIGLTVALFVSEQAFTASGPQGAAKMGALFSGGVALVALVLGRLLNVKDHPSQGNPQLEASRPPTTPSTEPEREVSRPPSRP